MAETPTASNVTAMTDEQIEEAVSLLRDTMREHRSGIYAHIAQQVLAMPNVGMLMFTPFRDAAAVINDWFSVKVNVDRSRDPLEAFKAAGMKFGNIEGLSSMPRREEEEIEVIFFKPSLEKYSQYTPKYMWHVAKEYALRGLEPADPLSIAAVYEANPEFMAPAMHNKEINCNTQWQDAHEKWYRATFSSIKGVWDTNHVRRLYMLSGGYYVDGEWFAGVRMRPPNDHSS